MTGEEYSDDWPDVDEATEVIRAYESASQLNPGDAQMHFNYGVAFMKLGAGLESHAVKAMPSKYSRQPRGCGQSGRRRTRSLALLTHQRTGGKRRSNLTSRLSNSSESLRRAVSLEPDLAEAGYGIGLAAIALGNDSMAHLQHERLTELDRGLATKLFEHQRRGSFTRTEVVSHLFEMATDAGRSKTRLTGRYG